MKPNIKSVGWVERNETQHQERRLGGRNETQHQERRLGGRNETQHS